MHPVRDEVTSSFSRHPARTRNALFAPQANTLVRSKAMIRLNAQFPAPILGSDGRVRQFTPSSRMPSWQEPHAGQRLWSVRREARFEPVGRINCQAAAGK